MCRKINLGSRLDEILKEFYTHSTGVDDYGCADCIEAKTAILRAVKECLPERKIGFIDLGWPVSRSKENGQADGWNDCLREINEMIDGAINANH